MGHHRRPTASSLTAVARLPRATLLPPRQTPRARSRPGKRQSSWRQGCAGGTLPVPITSRAVDREFFAFPVMLESLLSRYIVISPLHIFDVVFQMDPDTDAEPEPARRQAPAAADTRLISNLPVEYPSCNLVPEDVSGQLVHQAPSDRSHDLPA